MVDHPGPSGFAEAAASLGIGGEFLDDGYKGALRGGIKTVLVPHDNDRELSEVPKKIKDKLNVVKVKWIDEVLDIALER